MYVCIYLDIVFTIYSDIVFKNEHVFIFIFIVTILYLIYI